MDNFDGLKDHISLILRELDQVQGAIEILRKNELDNVKERSEILVELKRMVEKVESVNEMLHAKIDSVNSNLTEQMFENKKMLSWIIGGLAAGYGIFKTLGLDVLIGKKFGE